MTKQTHSFQAETKELLDLMIHSLYSHREIFLRELISNASDAIEKLKFESLTDTKLASQVGAFEIRLTPNADARTLSISDNGIGMTAEEVIKNIGTIAHSGTKSFVKMKTELKTHPEMIGQFGVGFYSAFMVADRVTLHTQKAGTSEGTLWESDASGSYTIESLPRIEGHGTTITLHLKPEQKDAASTEKTDANDSHDQSDDAAQDFTDTWTLKSLVKKYSDFVAFPVKMKMTREVTKESDDKSADPAKAVTETVIEDETLNSQKALWLKTPSDVTKEEHTEFFRHLSREWGEPAKTVHFKAEGTIEYTSVFYIPTQKSYNYDYNDRTSAMSLYIKRVFIMDNCENLLPNYLRFVRGMVDSNDLSLNVSREILQKDAQVGRIRKSLTGKVLNTLRDWLATDRPAYEKFWAQFGPTLKEGMVTEAANLDRLKDLTLFQSTASDALTTLREYFDRMKPGQKAIYFVTGESLSQIKNSPYLERLKVKGFEVLLLTDRVDAWVTNSLSKYEDKPLQSITADNLDLSSEEEKKQEAEIKKQAEAKLKPLIDQMQTALKEKVSEIKVSERLTESPVCLVSSGASSAHLERMMEAMGQAIPKSKRVLEINATHPLFEHMLKISGEKQGQWAELLYQQALLNEGSKLENPVLFSQQIANLMISASRES
jgi:molecular chaperone HtpG